MLFDRSWYNRAGVERVMGFCTEEQFQEFFHSVPEFERMLIRSGIILIKYWFSITDEEQQFRFTMRIHDPLKQWKLSPMDVQARSRWEQYTKAKEAMLEHTHLPDSPWWIVEAVDKKRARLNCISHLLDQIPYREVAAPAGRAAAAGPQPRLSPRADSAGDVRAGDASEGQQRPNLPTGAGFSAMRNGRCIAPGTYMSPARASLPLNPANRHHGPRPLNSGRASDIRAVNSGWWTGRFRTRCQAAWPPWNLSSIYQRLSDVIHIRSGRNDYR